MNSTVVKGPRFSLNIFLMGRCKMMIQRVFQISLILLLVPTFFRPASTWSAPPVKIDERAKVPTEPSAPPSLVHPIPQEHFGCKRQVYYQGHMLDCDSNLSRDAEALRPIIQEVPDAVRELNLYQTNRKRVQNLAYVGSAGLLAALLWPLVFRNIKDTDNMTMRNIFLGGGLGLMVGTTFYGLAILSTNEGHLDRAIENYNRAKPFDPLQLKVSTGWSF